MTSMLNLKCFHVNVDQRGVLTASLDLPDRPMNVFNDLVLRELHEVAQYVQAEAGKTVRMAVFRSGKASGFLAGADIHRLQVIEKRDEAEWILEQGQKLFGLIEQLPVPTLAVIHGPCLGGGLEFALACEYRIAVDEGSTRLGLPEVKLGLIPAWGGTQRLPKRVGLMRALPMVLEGQLLSAKKAYRAGLVDALISAPDSQSEIDLFVNDRLAHKPVHRPQRTWMQWAVNCTSFGRKAALKKAREGVRKYAQHYPALNRIIEAVETGLRFPTVNEEGLRAEREAFKDLLFGPVAPNLINIFMMQEKAKKSSTWTSDAQPREVKKIAVIGAGTMGAGIAQQAASRGYSVILQDVKDEFVNRGMDTIKGLFSKAVSKGAVPQAEADAALARTQPRVDWGPSDDVDLMIEAIIERLEVKEAVFRKADELLPAQAVLASNTSALPIEEMAKVTGRPAQVAGLHFFNPVHKMPLVEVVRAPQTSDETIATLVGVAKKLGKIPVVVKQSPGFLVNRILFPYLDEAARLVTEGYGVSDIDKAAKKFGMPMGPIELLDVVGIDVAFDVSKTLSPLSQEPTPTPDLFQRMVNAGLKGQKTGKGFFEWKDGKKAGPTSIPGLDAAARPPALPDWTVTGETFGAIQQRLVLSMLNEARKCLAEEVVTEPWMVDLGMVLGTGFAPFRGGPMRCIERWGADEVQARLRLLAEKCGRRFQPVEVSAGEHAVNKA